MAKDVIQVDGEDTVVREDTARAYRGVYWAITSVVIMLAILVFLFATLFMRSAVNAPQNTPAASNQK